MMKALQTLLLLVFILTAQAGDILTFATPEYKERYETLLEELRCLVCQNQNLADSNAGLAEDLKREVFKMVESGKTEEEIKSFLTLRYGDFVLYKPPFNARTLFLWLGPFVLFVLGFVLLFMNIRKRQLHKQTFSSLNKNEQSKLKDLLKQHGDKQ